MSTKIHTPSFAGLADNFNILPGLAQIYLNSSVRLGELTVQAANKTAEDYVSVTNAATHMSDSPGLFAFQSVLGQPVFERTLAYFRESCEILTQAQAEAAQLCGQAFAIPSDQLSVTENWGSLMSACAGGIKKLSAITEANVAAASGARDRFVAATGSHLKQAA